MIDTDRTDYCDPHRAALRTGIVYRQLQEIAPGVDAVHVTPLTVESRRVAWVTLDGSDGWPLWVSREAHAAAYGLLRRLMPHIDWRAGARTYYAASGEVTDCASELPPELADTSSPTWPEMVHHVADGDGDDTVVLAIADLRAAITAEDDADGFEDDDPYAEMTNADVMSYSEMAEMDRDAEFAFDAAAEEWAEEDGQ